jgi:hypothetical protein
MRLTTLARKIHLTPSKLVAFLKQNKVEIDNGINTRLDEQTIDMVLSHFDFEVSETAEVQEEIMAENASIEEVVETAEAPTKEAEVVQQEVVLPEIESPLPEQDEPETEISEPTIATPKVGTVDDLEEGLVEDIELIKAKKVKLEGIKVIGKIELPEKPKKEAPAEEEADAAHGSDDQEDPKNSQRKKQRKHQVQVAQKAKRSGLTISYEEKLRREEKIKKRELKLKMNKEKARKRAHYLKGVESKAAATAIRKKKKKDQQEFARQKRVLVHKNPIRRFWAWLNGAYDKY